MPKIKIGERVTVEMSMDEFIDFLKRTDPKEMMAKLSTLAEEKATEETAEEAKPVETT